MAITVPLGVPMFALACLLVGGFEALTRLSASGWMWMALAGGLVSYTAATLVVAVLLVLAGGVRFMRDLDRVALKWFALSGIFVFLSQMFRYMALAVAPVSVVVPIQRLSVVFRTIFSWFMNRDHEVFTGMVLLGIALSLVGATALTLSTDIVLSIMPAQWADFLSLEWP